MPKIPQYQRTQLPSGQVPSVRGDLATAALVPKAIAGVGEEMQDVGVLLAKHAAAKQDQRNDLETLSLWNQWQDKAFTMRQGYMGQKGLKATNIVSEYRTEYEKGFSEFLKGASNDQVKQALAKINSRSRMTGLTSLATYSRAETERFKGQEFADLKLHARNAVLEDSSDASFSEQAGIGLAFISKNYPGDENKKAEFYKEIIDTRVRGLIDSDPVKAKQVLKDNRVALGDDFYTLQDKLKSSEKAKEDEVKRQAKIVETVAENLKKEAVLETEDNFLDLSLKDQLTIPMVRDSVLSVQRQEHWISTVDKQAKGEKIFTVTDSGYYAEREQAIIEADGNYDWRLIHPIDKKLNRTDANFLRKFAKEIADPKTSYIAKMTSEATKTIEKQIQKGNELVGWDQATVDIAHNVKMELRKQIDAEDDLTKKRNMLDPSHKDYIVSKLITPHLHTLNEQVEIMARKFEGFGEKEPEEKSKYQITATDPTTGKRVGWDAEEREWKPIK